MQPVFFHTHFAPRDQKVAAIAASLSDLKEAKTEHGSGKDTATSGGGGFEAQPRAACRARTRRPQKQLQPYWYLAICMLMTATAGAQPTVATDLLKTQKSYFSETNPVWTADEQTLFFAMRGHPTNAGLVNLPDIWTAQRKDSIWLQPVPLGFPVNTELSEWPVGYRTATRELYFLITDATRQQTLVRSKKTAQGFSVPEVVQVPGLTQTDSIAYLRLLDDVLTGVVWRARQTWAVVWQLDTQGVVGTGYWIDARPSPAAQLASATYVRQHRQLLVTATSASKSEQGAYVLGLWADGFKEWSEPQPIYWLPDSLAAASQMTISDNLRYRLLSSGQEQNDLFYWPLEKHNTAMYNALLGMKPGSIPAPDVSFQACVAHGPSPVSPATFVLYDVEKTPQLVEQSHAGPSCATLPLAGKHLLVWATVPGYFIPAQPVEKQAFVQVRPDATQGIAFAGTQYVQRMLHETDSLLYELDKQRKAFKMLPLPALPQVSQQPRGKELEALSQAFNQYKLVYQTAPADVSAQIGSPDTSKTAQLAQVFAEYSGQPVTPGTRNQQATNHYTDDLPGLQAQFNAYHGLSNDPKPTAKTNMPPQAELTQSWLESEVQRIWHQQLKQELWSRMAPTVALGLEQSLTPEQRLHIPKAIDSVSLVLAQELIPVPPQSEKLDHAMLDLMREAARDYLHTALEARARHELEVELRYHALRVTREHLLKQQAAGAGIEREMPLDSVRVTASRQVTLQAYRIQAGVSFVMPAMLFAPDSDQLLPASDVEIDRLVHILRNEPQVVIELAAHTHSGVAKDRALYLTAARSRRIEQRLVAAGIASSRISAIGLGNTRLLDHDHTFRDMFDNERIELRIIRTK